MTGLVACGVAAAIAAVAIWNAAAAMALSSVSVVGNALRLKVTKV